ncbi:hypothetical protein GR11A_00182 [Vibrio phage vB_VcorM_GR11A]|nr:hypothetical protein GR11A_00182 [Vibrio phage vB_VcorM_GR11A]
METTTVTLNLTIPTFDAVTSGLATAGHWFMWVWLVGALILCAMRFRLRDNPRLRFMLYDLPDWWLIRSKWQQGRREDVALDLCAAAIMTVALPPCALFVAWMWREELKNPTKTN